jgi:hypothetical protein
LEGEVMAVLDVLEPVIYKTGIDHERKGGDI